MFLLEAWLELNSAMPQALDPPKLVPTWVELHPGVLDRDSGTGGLLRADEWLALAETIAAYAPASLSALGFPGQESTVLQVLIDSTVAASGTVGESRDLAERVLRRIHRLTPQHAYESSVSAAVQRLRMENEEPGGWWIPEDIPAPPTFELLSAGAGDFARSDINRVLADLGVDSTDPLIRLPPRSGKEPRPYR